MVPHDSLVLIRSAALVEATTGRRPALLFEVEHVAVRRLPHRRTTTPLRIRAADGLDLLHRPAWTVYGFPDFRDLALGTVKEGVRGGALRGVVQMAPR
jgi:hypothetical protein